MIPVLSSPAWGTTAPLLRLVSHLRGAAAAGQLSATEACTISSSSLQPSNWTLPRPTSASSSPDTCQPALPASLPPCTNRATPQQPQPVHSNCASCHPALHGVACTDYPTPCHPSGSSCTSTTTSRTLGSTINSPGVTLAVGVSRQLCAINRSGTPSTQQAAWLPALGAPSYSAWAAAASLAAQCRHAATLAYEQYYISKDTLAPVQPPPAGATADKGGAPAPLTAVFLHGLLGSSKNWRSFAKGLAIAAAKEQNRDVHVLMPDLRNHGNTTQVPGLHPPHTLQAAAADVRHFMEQHVAGGVPHLLVGLSLGGKIALEVLSQAAGLAATRAPLVGLAQQQQQQQQPAQCAADAAVRRLPQQVWVLDSQPSTLPMDDDHPGSVAGILRLIHSIPQPLASRGALYQLLQSKGISQAVAWWLGSALAADDRGRLRWAFNIQGAAAMFHSYRLTSYLDLLAAPPSGTTLHVVRGDKSDRWSPKMLQQLEECRQRCQADRAAGKDVGDLQLHVLQNAGHWLHADNPQGLQAMLLPWVKEM